MIYILGAGSMAEEVLSFYSNMDMLDIIGGFIEQNCKRQDETIRGKKIFDEEILLSLPVESTTLIAAIGSTKRSILIEALESKGYFFETLIHNTVISTEKNKIGKGCIICPGIILTTDITVKEHTIININCSINHDCKIGKYVTIGPGVNIAGKVTINDRCHIGIGAKIIDNITIGANTIIGAGAVVTENIPNNVIAVGVPARPIKELSKDDVNNYLIS